MRATNTSSRLAEWVRNSVSGMFCRASSASTAGTALCNSVTCICTAAAVCGDGTNAFDAAEALRICGGFAGRELEHVLDANAMRSIPRGVPSAITLPWSMMATRSQSRSASSM